jgi:thiol-disulfide isomerase/thioredoxin
MSTRSKLVLVLLVAGLSLATFATARELNNETQRKVRKLYSAARSLYQGKQYAKSTESFQEILKLLPASKEVQLDGFRAKINYDIACNYALLEDKKQSLETLSRAIDQGYWNAKYLAADPTLKSLQGEKKFQGLVKKSKELLARGFGLKDITGKEILAEDVEGKVLIVDVWGTWCGPCRREIPSFTKLQAKYREKGLRIIGLTWENRAPNETIKKHVEDFSAKNNINYPIILLSPEAYKATGARSFPTTFFIDRDGFVAETLRGVHSYESLETTALKLLSQPASTDGNASKGSK